MKNIIRSFLIITGLLIANIIYAELPNADTLGAIEATDPISNDSLPVGATYYSAAMPDGPPMPGPMGCDAWQVDSNTFLLDDVDGVSGRPSSFRSGAAGGMMSMDIPSPGDGGDGGGDDLFTNTCHFDTNSLWLEITGVSDGLTSVNLHNATNYVYEIYSKTDLLAPSWDIETEIFPSDTASMPFTVPTLERTNLFLWARDWTGIASLSNTAPEWWLWEYFGTTNVSDASLDADGNTIYSDYTNGLDPNIINFSISVTNQNVSNMSVPLQLNIASGLPSYMAVSVDDTNYATDAIWQIYTSSNLTVNLGLTEGAHNVWIGLRGHADATNAAVWQWKQLNLDFTPLVLAVTNPVSGTVSQPMIQLQGLANKNLSSLTFDVSNAVGVVTNQQSYWNQIFYDTNLSAFTTNSFQCYDIALTNGLNIITLHATDLAGNSTTTNFNFTLDYSGDTNPPALSILWPSSGTIISGTNFTVQAQMDDNTATITASIVNTNGETNTVQGLVERSGLVWVNDLPLTSGTNTVTITATDAAGNSTVANFNVIGNDIGLVIDPLASDQLNKTNVTVTGSIGDPVDDCVFVNGIQATVYDDGTWEADGVLVSATGTATLSVQVYVGDPVLIGSQNSYPAQPAQVALKSYSLTEHDNQTDHYFQYTYHGAGDESIHWDYASGGAYQSSGYFIYCASCEDNSSFNNAHSLPAGEGAYSATWENADETVIEGGTTTAEKIQTQVMIAPSGQQAIGQNALYLVMAQVINEDTGLQLAAGAVRFMNQLTGTTAEDVTNSDGSVWTTAVVSGAAGAPVEVTPKASGNVSFTGMTVSNVTLKIFAITNGTAVDLSNNVPEFCVGQQVTFSNAFDPPIHYSSPLAHWTLPDKFVNDSFQSNPPDGSLDYFKNADLLNNTNTSCWFINGNGGMVGLNMNVILPDGHAASFAAKGYFAVYRPSLTEFTNVSPTVTNAFEWLNGNKLSYGDSEADENGMDWKVRINSKYDGRMGISQIIKAHYWVSPTLLPDPINTLTAPAADAGEFYDIGDGGIYALDGTADYHASWTNYPEEQKIELEDFPNMTYPVLALWGEIQFADSADYVRFKPGLSSDDGNIYVTLGIVHWHADGYYERNTFIPEFETNSTPAASFPDGSNDFPIWYSIQPAKSK